jgi:hypothetical protein
MPSHGGLPRTVESTVLESSGTQSHAHAIANAQKAGESPLPLIDAEHALDLVHAVRRSELTSMPSPRPGSLLTSSRIGPETLTCPSPVPALDRPWPSLPGLLPPLYRARDREGEMGDRTSAFVAGASSGPSQSPSNAPAPPCFRSSINQPASSDDRGVFGSPGDHCAGGKARLPYFAPDIRRVPRSLC